MEEMITWIVGILLVVGYCSFLYYSSWLKYGGRSLPTKKDYTSHARLVGNGGHFFGGYDFYVIICPGCRHNEECEGCPNCHLHEAKIQKPYYDTIISYKCPDCRQEARLEACCSECGAIVAPPFINFYIGNFVPQVQTSKEEERGQNLPKHGDVTQLQMPIKTGAVQANQEVTPKSDTDSKWWV